MKKTAVHFSYNLALLFALPVFFILSYVWLYFNPSIVIYQHLSIISLIVLSILSIKLLIHHYFHQQKLVLFIGTILYSGFLFGLITYYALVFISLNAWSKVITKEFIVSYLAQLDYLFDALGVSYHLVVVSSVLFYCLIALGCYLFLKKFHWLPNQKTHGTWLLGPFILSLCVLFPVYAYLYITTDDKTSQEPLKLTLFSGKTSAIRTHAAKLDYSSDIQLNQSEQIARQTYTIAPVENKKNLIVIVVDGLRPDHMSAYGYPRDTTPYIKELSTRPSAHTFTNVRSVCGETTCAHAGFMASRFIHKLPDKLFTLQDVLKLHAYQSRFIISGDHINFNNIRDVYGNVDEYYDGSMAKGYYFNDDTIVINKTRTLPDWNGTPTMMHFHLLSAHIVGKKFPQYYKFLPYKRYSSMSDISEQPEFINHYDNGVLQADAVIHELIEVLRKKHYLENSLLVITSDHGEALGEHGVFTHTNNVIEEILRIPLIMLTFGYDSTLKTQDHDFMSIIDLAPTILTELGLNMPTSWAGEPAHRKIRRAFTFFEMSADKGLYDHRDEKRLWKYWRNFNTGEEFLYDIKQDPNEKRNLVWLTDTATLNAWRTIVNTNTAH